MVNKCTHASATLAQVIRVAQLFPRFVDQENSMELNREVTLGELETTLKWFKSDKSPRPDRLLVEFYIAFFEIHGDDLLKVIEECRTIGCMHGAINSTFITLIPKTGNPTSFDDFHHISLCNCIYKIIEKVIANHL